jgi:hypothetical protein
MEDLVRTIGELLDKAHELQASSNETFVVRTTQQPIDDLKSLEKMLSKYVSRITMSPWTPRERKRKQGGGRITPAELFTALLNRILPQLKQLSSVGVHKVHLDTELPDINSYKDIEDTAMLGLQFKRLQIVMDNTQNFMLLLVIHQGFFCFFWLSRRLFIFFFFFQGAIVEELKRKSASQADFLVLVHATLNTSIATAYRHLKAYKVCAFFLFFPLIFLFFSIFFIFSLIFLDSCGRCILALLRSKSPSLSLTPSQSSSSTPLSDSKKASLCTRASFFSPATRAVLLSRVSLVNQHSQRRLQLQQMLSLKRSSTPKTHRGTQQLLATALWTTSWPLAPTFSKLA